MPLIWSDEYLDRLSDDAETEILKETSDIHFYRFSLAVTNGTSTYTLPDYVRRFIKVTWKGKKLEFLSWEEMNIIGYSNAVVSGATRNEYSSGTPRYYSLHPNNYHNIRFLPTPNETITATSPVDDATVNSTAINTKVIVTCWRSPDVDTNGSIYVLPTYVARRTKKTYALWRAFLKEGKGQNLLASSYYEKKYKLACRYLKLINTGAWVSQLYALQYFNNRGALTPPPPQLPSNYGDVKV